MSTMEPVVKRNVGRKAWPALLHRVVRTIRSRRLIERGHHVLVAVSGGSDSIGMLSLLHRLRASWALTLTAIHFNYGLRGAESDADQEFVSTFCRERDISLQIRRLEVPLRLHHTSFQAAARDLRYRAMMDLAERCGADRIAVGHTADDQAETVLLWMLRGAGLTGLSGMPAHRGGNIIRPLYETRRYDVLKYLRDEGLSFRQDSSNAKPFYRRNRVRLEVLPVLQQVMPSSVDALCRLADICREDDDYLDQHVAALCASQVTQERDGAWKIDRTFLRQLPRAVQRRVVRDLLRRCDPLHRSPSMRAVEGLLRPLLQKKVPWRMEVRSARVLVDHDLVRFFPSKSSIMFTDRPCRAIPEVLAVPGRVAWTETGQIIQAQEVARKRLEATAHDRNRIVVDAGRLSAPLVVRAWRPGDRIHPSGMQGRSKKLQDFFTDLKVPSAMRRRIPVVVAPEGIVWIVGYRLDERWSLTGATERCLAITVQDAQSGGR